MKTKKVIEGRFIAIACSLLAIFCLILPWVIFDGKNYTLFAFLRAVQEAGGISGFAPDGGNIYLSYYMLYLGALALTLFILHGVLLIFNIQIRVMNTIMYWCESIYFISFAIFQGYEIGMALLLSILLIFGEFIAVMFCEQKREINEHYRLIKQREREEKAERKRRLHFPGKYAGEFRHVIWSNFKYKWKNYVLFILSGVLSAAFLMSAIGMNFMLRGVHSMEDIVLGTGIQQIFIRAIGLIAFITIFITAYVFSYYIKSRIADYRMFTILGIRSATLNLIMIVEYAGSMIVSFAAGLLLGTGFLAIMRNILVQRLGTEAEIAGISPVVYLCALVGYAVVIMISTAINYESYIKIRESFSVVQAVDKEPVPKRFLVVLLVLGLETVRESLWYSADTSLWDVVVFMIGMYFVLTRGKALAMRWRDKHGEAYFRNLLEKLPFYYRFKKSCRYLLMLTALHVLVLGVYLIHLNTSLIAPPEKELFPFDFVMAAHAEDKAAIDSIKDKYGAQIHELPMIRVTVPTGNAFDFMATMIDYAPPGQFIGISEQTYDKIYGILGRSKPQSLNLQGRELHIVYQQDSSFKLKPIDASPNATVTSPNLMMGQPDSNFPYELWKVKSYHIDVLTGMMQRGSQENLLVFSDEYFNKAFAEMEKEPTNLCLINAPKKYYRNVNQELSKLRELHIKDESYDYDIRTYYGKQQMVSDVTAERYMKETVYAFVILMLTACGCFLTYIKFSFEAGEISQRYGFFDCLGMHEKEQRKILRKEMWPFAGLPLIAGTAAAAVFTTFTLLSRLYNSEQIWDYFRTGGVIAICYVAIHILWMSWMVYQMERKIKKNMINVGRRDHNG